MSANQPETIAEHLQQSHAANKSEVTRLTNLVSETTAKLARAKAERDANFNPRTDGDVIGHEGDLARFRAALVQRQNVQTQLAARLSEMGVTVASDEDEADGDDTPDANGSEAGRGTWSSVRVQDSVRPLGRFRCRDASLPLPL